MNIYLIRHGRQNSRLCNVDVELAKEGREQADLLGKRLEKYDIDAVYSSQLIRAKETADIINSHLNITPGMKATGKQGRVIYSFNVDIDGSMKDFQLVRGLDPLMDAEALRVLQLVNERWSTGYYFNSKKWYREFYVNQFTIPIIFSW